MPPFSHWPVIAPPAAQFEQNTSLERNSSNHDRPQMTWHPFHIYLSLETCARKSAAPIYLLLLLLFLQ